MAQKMLMSCSHFRRTKKGVTMKVLSGTNFKAMSFLTLGCALGLAWIGSPARSAPPYVIGPFTFTSSDENFILNSGPNPALKIVAERLQKKWTKKLGVKKVSVDFSPSE